MRQAFTGIATPRSLIAIKLKRAFDPEKEMPLLLTFKASQDLLLRGTQPEQILVENVSDRIVPFVVIIISNNSLLLQNDWKTKLQAVLQQFLT